MIKTLGIIGAGKLGVTVAQLALKASYEVYIAGAGDPSEIALATKIITPGAIATTVEDAVGRADVVLLALPLKEFKTLNPEMFEGKLVLDGMNHWFEVDGSLEEIIPNGELTTRAVQKHLSGARVVKAFNHMGYHDLHDEARPRGEKGRKAMAFASDDESLKDEVAKFIDALGFDPLYIGNIDNSAILESGQPAFGANLPIEELTQLVKRKDLA